MTEEHGFSLLEVVLAAALLATVAGACVAIFQAPHARPHPVLNNTLPQNDLYWTTPTVNQSGSRVGESIRGHWMLNRHSNGFVLTWRRSSDGAP